MSDELARDPSSLVFLQLGEALRARGQLDVALRVATRGLERHSHNPEAHDLLARIAVDRGDLQQAFDEWDMVLRLEPTNQSARRGLGFVCYRQGNLADAERHLSAAVLDDPTDDRTASALAHVRADRRSRGENEAEAVPVASSRGPGGVPEGAVGGASAPAKPSVSVQASGAGEATGAPYGRAADPRALFREMVGDAEQTVLMLDRDGLVLAGAYVSADGRDVAQEIGAELSGVSDEATRAMRHLDLGEWTSILVETTAAIIALAPAPVEGLLVMAAERSTPLGLVKRQLERASDVARAWLAGGAR
ncbi:MAG: hypothetical protein NVS1B4_05420 [Gemmatimonadaceae bacterium]